MEIMYNIEKIISNISDTRNGRDKEIIKNYFSNNQSDIDEVARAYYAYHTNWLDSNAHSFTNASKHCKCIWCGQTREGIRWNWYGLPPKCTKRPKEADTFPGSECVISAEEEKYEKLISKANSVAIELDISTLSGEKLAILHHTYGIDPSVLEAALMAVGKGTISQELHDSYELEMKKEVAKSKANRKKIIISVNTEELL